MAVFGCGSTSFPNTADTGLNVETVVCTTPLYVVPRESETCIIMASMRVVLGASATGYTTRIRRGPNLTDTQLIQQPALTGVAGNNLVATIQWFDVLTGFATVQYSLTFQAVGETVISAYGSPAIWMLSLL